MFDHSYHYEWQGSNNEQAVVRLGQQPRQQKKGIRAICNKFPSPLPPFFFIFYNILTIQLDYV